MHRCIGTWPSEIGYITKVVDICGIMALQSDSVLVATDLQIFLSTLQDHHLLK